MPKKKLTKTQVIRKLRTVSNAMYDLFLDKFGHGSASLVPISQDKLKDINAYSQFYNPIKDKLVTYGTPESDVLPLSQLMSKVISGEKKLNKGGIVSMEEMIKRPIYERY